MPLREQKHLLLLLLLFFDPFLFPLAIFFFQVKSIKELEVYLSDLVRDVKV